VVCRPRPAPGDRADTADAELLRGVQGILSIACALLGAPYVLGVDLDQDSLAIAVENVADFDELPVELVQADVSNLATLLCGHGAQGNALCDLVVCNPPFGAWVKGADTAFLAAAFKVSPAPGSTLCIQRRTALHSACNGDVRRRASHTDMKPIGSACICLPLRACKGGARGGVLPAQALDTRTHPEARD